MMKHTVLEPDNLVLIPTPALTSYLTLGKMLWKRELDEALIQIQGIYILSLRQTPEGEITEPKAMNANASQWPQGRLLN